MHLHSSSNFSLYSNPFILHYSLHLAIQSELGEGDLLSGNCLPRSRDVFEVQREDTVGWTREVGSVHAEKRGDPFQATEIATVSPIL